METNTVESNVTARGATQSTSRTYLSSSRSYATTNFQLPTVNSFLTPSTLRETPAAARGPRDISDEELIELYARMERLKLQANSLYGPPPAQLACPTQPLLQRGQSLAGATTLATITPSAALPQ